MCPSLNLNSIVFLSFEVILDVVNDDGLGQVSANAAQVFHVHSIIQLSVLPVESVFDQVALLVQVVQYEVSVVLRSRCENHNFK